MRGFFCLFLLFISSHVFSQAQLLEAEWEFRQVGKTEWHPATVPGTVHTDLLANALIPDPFAGMNEVELQWIENENWEYRTTFKVDGKLLKKQHLQLSFEGLDTYASVYLNDSLILEADNMFRSWQIDATGLLKKKGNDLRVVFTSPILKNKSLVEYHLPLPAGVDTTAYPVAPFTRKAAYHFGWDWAPRFVTMGIWKDIKISAWNDAKINDVFFDAVQIDSSAATIVGSIEINSDSTTTLDLIVEGFYEGQLEVKSGLHAYPFTFLINDPELWWPNGQGEAHLYSFKTIINSGKNQIDSYSQIFGLRNIELIQEADSIGTAYYFKVNGKPTFMQGANYVPQDMFLPRVDTSQYRRLLTQVRDANMNMLRVWGGGIYERDYFYQLCDEFGILVWQDFMFAGTLYPADEAFVDNITAEAKEQIKRLRKHTCLALWCGNNEIEVAWNNWGWQKQYGYSAADSTKLWKDYQTIFKQLLLELVQELNPSVQYVSTSPLSNWGTAENFNHSSMHYWGVWHGDDYFDGYEKYVGRFMVEYGFQSYPSFDLLSQYIDSEELSLSSETIRMRQKSYVGNGKILAFILKYQNFIPTDFEDIVRASQEVQAKGISDAMRVHKASQPHCMGSLVWQLNDVWPGPSWSLINYDGTPKPVYEEVKKVLKE